MPFALSPKASKGKLNSRRPAPTPLELRQEQTQQPSLPTPPSTGESMTPNTGFKMFWKKRSTSINARPVFPSEPPRPILKAHQENGRVPSIRFAGQRSAPAIVVSQYDPQPVFETSVAIPRAPSPARRSSRPLSPAASSFGTRVRMESAPVLSTPSKPSHVTTPPTAYVSSMQTRAPPPPSPYRSTHERSRSVTRTRTLPDALPMMTDFVPRPPRHSSLFPSSDSTSTLPGSCVPMLNIIPATPQETTDEFSGARDASRRSRFSGGLEEAVKIDEMEDISLDPLPDLDFSPFDAHISLPLEDPLPLPASPPSQPFESFPSLPSLESHNSMPSSASDDSMPSSASNSSLISFPDVEEALGSMLASLSDSNMVLTNEESGLGLNLEINPKPGLGLGLGFDMPTMSSITAPLSPRRRPPPLDLNLAKRKCAPAQQTAPPWVNHRIAFYGTARAHPNSPTSGIFTLTHSPSNSVELPSHRDSISLASEASDDDLHTASIISLTPVVGGSAVVMEGILSGAMEIDAGEEMVVDEVGLAF